MENEKYYRRAAIYARTKSFEAEGENVLEEQIANTYSMIEDKPDMELTALYSDEGCDGIALMRPQFMKMVGDILAGEIDVVVVEDLGTISTNIIELCYLLTEIFPELGVKVDFAYAILDCDIDDDMSCLVEAMGRYSSFRADMNR